MIHTTELELERMARSRTRNILGQMEREGLSDVQRIAIRLKQIVKVARNTKKSIENARRRIQQMTSNLEVMVKLEKTGIEAHSIFIFRTRPIRMGFEEDGVMVRQYCTDQTTSVNETSVFMTEHFIMRLTQRGFGVARMDYDKLTLTASFLIRVGMHLRIMGWCKNGELLIPCRERETQEGFIIVLKPYRNTAATKLTWVAQTIFPQGNNRRTEIARKTEKAIAEKDSAALEKLVQRRD